MRGIWAGKPPERGRGSLSRRAVQGPEKRRGEGRQAVNKRQYTFFPGVPAARARKTERDSSGMVKKYTILILKFL